MANTLNIRKFLLVLGDIVFLYLSLIATIFFGYWGSFGWEIVSSHFLPFSMLYFFWLVIFYIFGLYELRIVRAGSLFYAKIAGGLLACFLVGISFFYLIPIFDITPKTNLIINTLAFGVLFLIWRKAFFALFAGRLLNRVAIVGEDGIKQELKEAILNRPYLGYKLVEIDEQKDLLKEIKENKIDTLIIPAELNPESKLAKELYGLLPARINFMDWAQAYELICEKIPVSFIPHSWFLKNLKEGERAVYDRFKRTADIILSFLIVIITSPVSVVISLIIKLQDGKSVLYRQERVGRDGKRFSLLKFRSMKENAEDRTGAVWAEEKDPRVTKIGKFLRSSHFDELPQMLNILKGDISLVGPRPERPEFVEQLSGEIPHYQIRHLIKPGFTGWAQIKFRYGRTIMDAKEKFEYDLYYLKNRNPLLDLGILLKTIQLFFKKN